MTITFATYKNIHVFSIFANFMCDINTDQQSKPIKTKCLPVFVKEKQIMVHFMAFSCKTGSIKRWSELDVSAPTRGGFSWLLARLSLQLKIMFLRIYLAFISLGLICFLSRYVLPNCHDCFSVIDLNDLWMPVRWGIGGSARMGT